MPEGSKGEVGSEPLSLEERLQTVEDVIRLDPLILGSRAYYFFENNALDQQEDFINGRDVDFQYDNLNIDELREQEILLRGLLLKIFDSKGSLKADAMYKALEWRHSEICMIGWASEILEAESEIPPTELIDWFTLANDGLYTKPQPHIFTALAQREISPLLEDPITSEHERARAIQRQLASLLGEIPPTDYEIFEPDEEMLAVLGRAIQGRLGDLTKPIDPSMEYTPTEAALQLEASLNQIGLSEEGWEIELNPSGAELAVSAAESKVKVGEKRADIDGYTLQSRALHEIGVHALRAVNAIRANWPSAAYGQDDYLAFEEGCATAFEDAFKQEIKTHGIQYYLAAGFAQGLDNHEPRNMRDVYEIIWRYKVLGRYGYDDITNKDIKRAKATSFRQTVRIFRGTDGKHPGVVYTKDLAYFNGQQKAWSILKDVRDPSDLDFILSGKLDLTNEFHRKIAEEIVQKTA